MQRMLALRSAAIASANDSVPLSCSPSMPEISITLALWRRQFLSVRLSPNRCSFSSGSSPFVLAVVARMPAAISGSVRCRAAAKPRTRPRRLSPKSGERRSPSGAVRQRSGFVVPVALEARCSSGSPPVDQPSASDGGQRASAIAPSGETAIAGSIGRLRVTVLLSGFGNAGFTGARFAGQFFPAVRRRRPSCGRTSGRPASAPRA